MRKIIGMVLLLLGLCLVTILINPRFLIGVNLQNLTRQIALLAVFAIGEGIVILSGGIDLSVGSIIAFTGLVACLGLTKWNLSPMLTVLIVVAGCVVIGLWHGLLVAKLKLQPFIVTLCTMLIFRGLARYMVGDETMGFGEKFQGFRSLGDGLVFGVIPTPVVILAVVAVVAAFFMHFTIYGRYLYAIGRNPNAVEYSGVSVGKIQTLSYIICAVLTGIAGILYAAYTNSTQPASSGSAYELYAIAAAVLGGCSMRGGEGSIFGIIIGAAVLKVMANGINLVGISTFLEFTVIGVVILGGVIADAAYKQRTAQRVKKT
jgi:ribose transport system permease protein